MIWSLLGGGGSSDEGFLVLADLLLFLLRVTEGT